MRNYFLIALLLLGCVSMDAYTPPKSPRRKATSSRVKQYQDKTEKDTVETPPKDIPVEEPKEEFDYSDILALQIPTVEYVLQAKKDPVTKKYGFQNVGEKQYWWAEAHKLGTKKEELNSELQTQWVIAPQYDKASKYFSEGLAAVEINGKVGFIDQFNRFIIQPQFEHDDNDMESFHLGLAPVKKGGKYGYINKRGEFLILPGFDKAEGFSDDMVAIVKYGNKFGCIDLNGDTVVPCTYIAKEIMTTVPIKNKPYKTALNDVKANYEAGNYSEMIARIIPGEDHAFSLLDDLKHMPLSDGVTVPRKGEVTDIEDGFFLWKVEDRYGVFDSYDRVIVQPNYRSVRYQPNEKVFVVEEMTHGDGKPAFGILNRSGGWIIPPVFEALSDFDKGFARGSVGEHSTMVDTNGLVEPSFIETMLKASSEETNTYYTQRLIGIWPTCAPAHNNMGIYYASSQDDLKHAINHFTVAHRLDPDNEDFKTNMKSAKSQRNSRRWNRVLTGLQIAGAVLTIGALTYSAVSGNTVMASSDFTSAGLSSFGDNGSNSSAASYGSSPSESSGKKNGLSEATYLDLYRRHEQTAKSCFDGLTVAGSRTQKDGKDVSGSAEGTWGFASFMGMQKNLRVAQKAMRKLRDEARRNGVIIPVSEYESVNVSEY